MWAIRARARLDKVPSAVVELEAVAPGRGVQHLCLHGPSGGPRRQAVLQLVVQLLQRRLQRATEFVTILRAPSVVCTASQTPPAPSPAASLWCAALQRLHLGCHIIARASRLGFHCFGLGTTDGGPAPMQYWDLGRSSYRRATDGAIDIT